MSGINLRVFRRNTKNLIFLWNQAHLSDSQKASITAFLCKEENKKELQWKAFVPEDPQKFTADVGGVVIPHEGNGISPEQECTIAICFGDGEDKLELAREVKPANYSTAKKKGLATTGARVYLHVFNYETNEWIPCSHTGFGSSLPPYPLFLKEGE